MTKTMNKKKGGNNIRYVIEAIDVDGDGSIDGDLIKQYKGDKFIAQKFVAKKKIEKIVNNAIERSPSIMREHNEKVIYKNNPLHEENKPLIIKNETNFGQHLKAGVGLGAGMAIGESLVDGIMDGLGDLF